MRADVHVRAYIYVYARTYIYIYTCMHAHAYMPTSRALAPANAYYVVHKQSVMFTTHVLSRGSIK